jgi:sulfur carrier protein
MGREQPRAGLDVRISLNGEPYDTRARTLAELLGEAGFADASVATALNGAFVPRGARGDRMLAPGDRVEVVSPRQGG